MIECISSLKLQTADVLKYIAVEKDILNLLSFGYNTFEQSLEIINKISSKLKWVP